MCSLWMIGGAILAGCGAGVASLIVGGLGVRWQTLRALRVLTDTVDDLHGRVDREVKRRAADVAVSKRDKDAELMEALVGRARDPVQSLPADPRSAIRARARQQGLM
jgi:hypothetical protein